jgi:hypothetical protein
MTKTETISAQQNELTLAELKREISILESENEIMRKLSTRKGFYQYYFSKLPYYETFLACFNAVNDEFLDLFGSYRYLSYGEFKKITVHNGN